MTLRCWFAIKLAMTLILATFAGRTEAAISYTGGLYTEGFNGLPNNLPENASIETVYTDGWQDDVDYLTSPENDVSVLGWHLYHPISPAAENGFNGNQRLRSGPGANTGAFWAFSTTAADTEKALGSIGSTTTAADNASLYMGLQLINNTGSPLNRFTLTFDGEQWRDGALTTPETLAFEYSLLATDANWFTPGGGLFTAAPALDFVAPVFSGSGAAVDGNGAGRMNNITATITGFTWAPGSELWLRWGDPQAPSAADDGLAIDDVEFMADNLGVGNPNDIVSVMTGNSTTPATWSNNAAPTAGNTYTVVSGHTVTVVAPFAGDLLRGQAGGVVNIGPGGNATDIRLLIIDDNSNLTETVSGDFQLGDAFSGNPALGILSLSENLTFNLDAGADARIDLAVSGSGGIAFNTNGAGSDVLLFDVSAMGGPVDFNGSGDKLRIVQNNSTPRINMNSTGTNVLSFEGANATGGGVVAFLLPGTLDHATASTNSNRLIQRSVLQATGNVTVDLTKTFVPDGVSVFNERRLSITDALTGAANITVNGTASDSTNLPAGITLNEFEFGFTADPTGAIPSNTFSGTLTANNYVNVELRHSLPAARLVVNDNARLEMGHQVVGTAKIINFGEIQVNAGGTLEVGFEQVESGAGNNGTGNHVGHLNLDNTDGRAGSLTLTNGVLSNPGDPNSEPLGSMVVLQVNGKNANEFDTISARTAALDGVLKILVNPPSSILGAPTATPPVAATRNPIYNPQLGDTIPLITASGAVSLTADFDDNFSVNGADLTVWRGAYGSTAAGDADADGDSDGNDFLAWQRQLGSVATGGITGTFDSVVFVDIDNGALVPSNPHPDTTPAVLVTPAGVITGTGLKFQIQYTSTAVNLVVVSAAIATIPEPATALLATFGAIGLAIVRRRRG